MLQDGVNPESFKIFILSTVSKNEAINPLTAPKSITNPVNFLVASKFIVTEVYKRARRDSNPQPSDPKSDALSVELRAPSQVSLILPESKLQSGDLLQLEDFTRHTLAFRFIED